MYSLPKMFVLVTVSILSLASWSATGEVTLPKTSQESSNVLTSSNLERISRNTECCDGAIGPPGPKGLRDLQDHKDPRDMKDTRGGQAFKAFKAFQVHRVLI